MFQGSEYKNILENYEKEFPPLNKAGLTSKPDNQVFNDKITIMLLRGQLSVLWIVILFSEKIF